MKQPLMAAAAKPATLVLLAAAVVVDGALQFLSHTGGSDNWAIAAPAMFPEEAAGEAAVPRGLELPGSGAGAPGLGIADPPPPQQVPVFQEVPAFREGGWAQAAAMTEPRPGAAFLEAGVLARVGEDLPSSQAGLFADPLPLPAAQAATGQGARPRLHREMATLLATQESEISMLERQLEAKQKQLVSQTDMLHVGFLEGVFQTFKLPRILWLHQLLSICVYTVFIVAAGWIYGAMIMDKEYAPLRRRPLVARDRFSFHLFDGLQCDPDWRICMFSCLFTPIRWADTASSIKIRFLHFWPALIIFAVLASFSCLTLGITLVLLLLIVVQQRQRIRQVYGLPYATWETRSEDCLTWTFCGPCAAMQEAMEVEFIDPPFVH